MFVVVFINYVVILKRTLLGVKNRYLFAGLVGFDGLGFFDFFSLLTAAVFTHY